MSTEIHANLKLAVLIDADNATPVVADPLLAEIAKYGTSIVRRAYGDWTGTNLRGWKDELLTQSIQPIQQFAYTQGKNATDSAMIIDAMDLLYTNRYDGFCLVSSDSDFTRLAARIRESGLVVYGFGERKTPKPFVAACDKFVYFDNLHVTHAAAEGGGAGMVAPATPQATVATVTGHYTAPVVISPHHRRASSGRTKIDAKLEHQLRMAVEASSDEEGWANLSRVASLIMKQRPDFDPRTYGYFKFSEVVIATDGFDVKRALTEVYVRDKQRKHAGSSGSGHGS